MISPVRSEDDVALSDLDVAADARRGIGPRTTSELLAALTMLTRFPIPGHRGAGTGAAAFGVVGGLLGLIGALPLIALGGATVPVAAIVAIAVIAIVSGAVHLDGLADTADALLAMGPDGAERARTDPSVGVGGVTALILVLAADVTSLAVIATDTGPLVAGIACVVAGAVSRACPVALARLSRARAAGTGLGSWFAARVTTRATLIATGSSLAILLGALWVLGLAGPDVGVVVAGAGLIGGLSGLVLGAGIVRARGQLDGDVLGASVELSFALTVVVTAVLIGLVG